ncbi:NAD-dependent epimerase/dehydratase family protein [Myxococcaceae bacterium GXIMD 01537]
MRAFVTGGSGFVGKRLIAALKRQGHEVRALARSEAAREAVRAAGAEPVDGDLSDVGPLQQGMAGCDVVFHSAALVSMWGTRADFVEANVRGTERVIEAARAAGVKRFVHVSSEAVLVDGTPLSNADETRPLPERAIGLYPSTKNEAERLVRSVNSPEMATVIVRPRLIWGPGDTTVLPQLVEMVKAGRFSWMSGGHYKTSTCHVDNCVEGLLLAAEKGRGGEAYFLTDGEPVEFREFITALLRTRGVEAGRKSVPFGLAYSLAWGLEHLWTAFGITRKPPLTRAEVLLVGQEMTVSDAKAREELGYQGQVSRAQGLRELASEAPAKAA